MGDADRLADRFDIIHDTRGSVDLRHQDGLDRPATLGLVGFEVRFDLGRAHGPAHVAFQDLDLDAHAARRDAPADREAAAFQHQDAVALRQHVGEGGLPGAMAVGDVDVGVAVGAEHARDIAQQAVGQRQQGAGINVDGRPVHRPQHFVGHRRRTGNSQELTPCTHTHRFLHFVAGRLPQVG